MKWQPIEDAKKDGTPYLVRGPEDFLGRRRNWHMQTVYWSIKDPSVKGWEIYGGGYLPFEPVEFLSVFELADLPSKVYVK